MRREVSPETTPTTKGGSLAASSLKALSTMARSTAIQKKGSSRNDSPPISSGAPDDQTLSI